MNFFSSRKKEYGHTQFSSYDRKISESVVKSDKTGKPKLKHQSGRTKDLFWHKRLLTVTMLAFLLPWAKAMHPRPFHMSSVEYCYAMAVYNWYIICRAQSKKLRVKATSEV